MNKENEESNPQNQEQTEEMEEKEKRRMRNLSSTKNEISLLGKRVIRRPNKIRTENYLTKNLDNKF